MFAGQDDCQQRPAKRHESHAGLVSVSNLVQQPLSLGAAKTNQRRRGGVSSAALSNPGLRQRFLSLLTLPQPPAEHFRRLSPSALPDLTDRLARTADSQRCHLIRLRFPAQVTFCAWLLGSLCLVVACPRSPSPLFCRSLHFPDDGQIGSPAEPPIAGVYGTFPHTFASFSNLYTSVFGCLFHAVMFCMGFLSCRVLVRRWFPRSLARHAFPR